MRTRIMLFCLMILAATACRKQEYIVYDNPYVYVVWADDASMSETSTILSKANGAVRAYNICLSSKKRDTPLTVNYEIVHGDGLTEGVDFEILTEGSSVVFEPGTYLAKVELKFLRRTVKKDQDNTITIRLTGASADINLGVPGATPKNVSHTVKKVN